MEDFQRWCEDPLNKWTLWKRVGCTSGEGVLCEIGGSLISFPHLQIIRMFPQAIDEWEQCSLMAAEYISETLCTDMTKRKVLRKTSFKDQKASSLFDFCIFLASLSEVLYSGKTLWTYRYTIQGWFLVKPAIPNPSKGRKEKGKRVTS